MDPLTTKHLDLPDITIAYRECGQGKNLILLHGNSGSKSFFKRHQLEHFKDYHTFALDSRGHGRSESTDESLSIEGFADDVIAFCRKLGIEEAYVVGYSDGGNIALFLASKAPGLFPKLVAISPNTLVSGLTDSALRLFKRFYEVFLFLGKLGFDTAKARMRFDLMLGDIGLPAAELGAIATLMRILYAQDDMIKEEHILEIARAIPGATVGKIAKCSHLSIAYKPDTIADIRSFLAG